MSQRQRLTTENIFRSNTSVLFGVLFGNIW